MIDLSRVEGLLIADLNGTLVDVEGRRGELFVAGSTWKWKPGVLNALQLLVRGHSWGLAIATDQPGSCRDEQTTPEHIGNFLQDVSAAMLQDAAVSADVFVCLHDTVHDCDCRKPLAAKPLWDLAREAERHRLETWVVGDTWKDVHLARNLQVNACKIGHFGYESTGDTPLPIRTRRPDLWVPTFAEAVRIITGEDFV